MCFLNTYITHVNSENSFISDTESVLLAKNIGINIFSFQLAFLGLENLLLPLIKILYQYQIDLK